MKTIGGNKGKEGGKMPTSSVKAVTGSGKMQMPKPKSLDGTKSK